MTKSYYEIHDRFILVSVLSQVVDISLKMVALHAEYADTIISLAEQSTVTGFPINRPLWWIDPLDPVAQTIDSGENIF